MIPMNGDRAKRARRSADGGAAAAVDPRLPVIVHRLDCASITVFVVAVLVAMLAILATKPELILPHKIHAAISMKGWDGFSKIVVANVAQRTRGQRTTKSREAWYKLLGDLRDIDVEFLSPRSDVVTAEEVAQGHEFILHLLSIGLEAYVINADPTRPAFKNLFNPDCKWLVDQPDAVYLTATISTEHAYIIDGTHSSEVYFSFTVYRHDGGGGWAKEVIAETAYPRSSVSGLPIAPVSEGSAKGQYRLYVSATKPTETLAPHEQWLQIPSVAEAGPGEVSIISRHYFEGVTSIQMVDGRARNDVPVTIRVDESAEERAERGLFPPVPSDENVAQRINFLSNFLVDHSGLGCCCSRSPSACARARALALTLYFSPHRHHPSSPRTSPRTCERSHHVRPRGAAIEAPIPPHPAVVLYRIECDGRPG